MITQQSMQQYLLEKISLAPAMKIEVQELSEHRAKLLAPLAANFNHMGTAFGGSLVNLSLMAGYSLVYRNMQQDQLDAHLVIARQEMRFIAPVAQDFTATATFDDGVVWSDVSRTYQKRGRSRLPLLIEVLSDGVKVGQMSADFALVKIEA